MLLLSENLPAPPPPGPAFPKIYPEIDQDILTESEKFTEGQPYRAVRAAARAGAGVVAARRQQRSRLLGADPL